MDNFIKLSNGYAMPKIGIGTYNLDKTEVKEVILKALKLGYRHIETAPIYLNEKEIGEAIAASGIDRDKIFITSKIPPHIKSYDRTIKVYERSLKNFGLDYVDALLINNPVPWGDEDKDYAKENLEVWRALETLYQEERVGAIGVSNFDINDLEKLVPFVNIKPHINQVGIFVGHTLDELRLYCQNHGIVVQGHSPLARGRLLKLEALNETAKTYELNPAQIAIKYVLEKQVYPIVKASSEAHLKENLVLDIKLPENWYQTLDEIDKDVRDYKPPKAKSIL